MKRSVLRTKMLLADLGVQYCSSNLALMPTNYGRNPGGRQIYLDGISKKAATVNRNYGCRNYEITS